VVFQANGGGGEGGEGSDATSAMTVDIAESAVNAGTAGSVFDNDGGILRISDLAVTEVDAATLIATANLGSSFLSDSSVSESAFDSITSTGTGAGQGIVNVDVTRMRRLDDAFVVEDAGSTLSIVRVSIGNNENINGNGGNSGGSGTRWTAVSAKRSASAFVSETTMSGNVGLEFGYAAVGSGSSVSVRDSFFNNNTGTVRTILIR